MAVIAAVRAERPGVEGIVEVSLAGHVIVEADDVGRARVRDQPIQRTLTRTDMPQPRPQRVRMIDTPTQEIDAEPAPQVLVIRLVLERRRGPRRPKIFGDD